MFSLVLVESCRGKDLRLMFQRVLGTGVGWLLLRLSQCLPKAPVLASTSKQGNQKVEDEKQKTFVDVVVGSRESELHGSVSKMEYEPEMNMEVDFAIDHVAAVSIERGCCEVVWYNIEDAFRRALCLGLS